MEEFANIVNVRELSDGRIIVSDNRENRVVAIDPRSGRAIQMGRRGRGPGEYLVASPIIALRGDSSLMAGQGYLVFVGDRILSAMPPERVAALGVHIPFGGDSLGNLFAVRRALPKLSAGESTVDGRDSSIVLRIHLADFRVDTVGRLRSRPAAMKVGRFPDGSTAQRITPPPLAVAEEAASFADGWLAIVRLEPYRVDWLAPDGRWIRGAPLPDSAAALTERDRKAITDSFPERPRRMPEYDWSAFPANVPPFQNPAVVAMRDGRVVIRRTTTATQPEGRYDIVDRRGALVGRITLPRDERIVGFGASSVYVSATDDVGIQRIRKHPWPR